MCHHVNNVERAAEELLKWTKRGPKWNYAVRICMACLADQMPTQEARKAFESAANEEGMFLTRPSMPRTRPSRSPDPVAYAAFDFLVASRNSAFQIGNTLRQEIASNGKFSATEQHGKRGKGCRVSHHQRGVTSITAIRSCIEHRHSQPSTGGVESELIATPPGRRWASSVGSSTPTAWASATAIAALRRRPMALARVRRHGAFIGRSFEWVIEVTEFEPGRLVRMKYVSGPFAGGVDYSILPVGEGSEVVIRNYGNANFWFPFMAAMMRASVQAGRLERLVA
ncbi:DUF982 domain-containing protein [Mesorhizobium sp. M0276]